MPRQTANPLHAHHCRPVSLESHFAKFNYLWPAMNFRTGFLESIPPGGLHSNGSPSMLPRTGLLLPKYRFKSRETSNMKIQILTHVGHKMKLIDPKTTSTLDSSNMLSWNQRKYMFFSAPGAMPWSWRIYNHTVAGVCIGYLGAQNTRIR
jgi:uncharacterized protein YfiM (DUF2279 family)